MARQQGITGKVEVVVSLDDQGNVTRAEIQTSPSKILNAASLAAARATTYFPALRDCVQVPSRYLFTVYFS